MSEKGNKEIAFFGVKFVIFGDIWPIFLDLLENVA